MVVALVAILLVMLVKVMVLVMVVYRYTENDCFRLFKKFLIIFECMVYVVAVLDKYCIYIIWKNGTQMTIQSLSKRFVSGLQEENSGTLAIICRLVLTYFYLL